LLVLREGAVELELCDQPATGEVIVEHYRVAAVGRVELTGAPEAGPKSVDGGGPHDSRARAFVVYRYRYVHDLYVLIRTGRAICIGGHKGEAEYIASILCALAFEIETWGYTWQQAVELLCHRIRSSAAEGITRGTRLQHFLGGTLCVVAIRRSHVTQRGRHIVAGCRKLPTVLWHAQVERKAQESAKAELAKCVASLDLLGRKLRREHLKPTREGRQLAALLGK
jgi:hypothetical protein